MGFFVCVWISDFLSEWQGNKTSWTNVYSLLSKTTSNRNKETHLATSDLIDNRQLFKLSGCLRNYVSFVICSLSIFLKPWWEAIYITESQTSRRIRAIGKMPVGIAWWSKINQTLVSWFLAISNYKIAHSQQFSKNAKIQCNFEKINTPKLLKFIFDKIMCSKPSLRSMRKWFKKYFFLQISFKSEGKMLILFHLFPTTKFINQTDRC